MSATKLNITTETLPASRLSIKITVPSERCKSSYEDAIKKLSLNSKLPGFRKGKVPRPVLIQQIGNIFEIL